MDERIKKKDKGIDSHLSYNDRVEAWAERNSRSLKILYCVWSVSIVFFIILFTATDFEIHFNADEVPVGFMDTEKFPKGEEVCIDFLNEDGEVIGQECMIP